MASIGLVDDLRDLLEQIGMAPCMPVRCMEEVLRAGDAAVPHVVDALARWDQSYDRLWAIVLAGELRAPAAIDALREELVRPDLDLLAVAATEALAKIGRPALPVLSRLMHEALPLTRVHAYAALGWLADGEAYQLLLDRLTTDDELRDVVACALVDQGNREATAPLWSAYQACPPWQRADLADAIRELHRTDRPALTLRQDWRLRYRRRAQWGTFDPGWLGVALILRQDSAPGRRPDTPLHDSFEELLENDPDPMSPELCEECGAPIERPTGVAVCPDTALGAAILQHRLLGEMRDGGIEDLFDVLDYVEDATFARIAKRRRKATLRDDENAILGETCDWAIAEGIEDVAAARAFLLADAARLAQLHGDPDGLLTPVPPLRIEAPKAGRNDPCPCGSGKKYKRCCLGGAEA